MIEPHRFDTEFVYQERASRDTVDFKRAYVDMADDLLAGLLLSQIVYWHLPDKEGKTKLRVEKGGHLWIAKKREDWWDEIRMTPRQIDRAIAILKERGLVITHRYRFNGSPTTHVRINKTKFMKLWGLAIRGQLTQGVLPALDVNDEKVKSESPNGEMDFNETSKTLTETPTETMPESTTITFSPAHDQETQQERHGADYLETLLKAKARKASDETSFTLPETAGGADAYKDGPLTQWCHLIGRQRANLSPAEERSWARELRKLAELRGADAETLAWALQQWGRAIVAYSLDKSKVAWFPGNIEWKAPTPSFLYAHEQLSMDLAPLLEWGMEHGLTDIDLGQGPQQNVAVERAEPPPRMEI